MVCGIVACKDNGKVGGYSDGCVTGSGGYKVVVGVCGFGFGLGMSEGWRRERTSTHVLPR